MLRWLAEVEPQLVEIETWNHADNRYMVDVNEALGYRLSRVYNTYELTLTSAADAPSTGDALDRPVRDQLADSVRA